MHEWKWIFQHQQSGFVIITLKVECQILVFIIRQMKFEKLRSLIWYPNFYVHCSFPLWFIEKWQSVNSCTQLRRDAGYEACIYNSAKMFKIDKKDLNKYEDSSIYAKVDHNLA